MKLKKHEKYEIWWLDTFGYEGWHSEENIDKKTEQMKLVRHIGFFIKEDKNFIIIAMGFDDNVDFNPYNHPKWVPKGFIKKIKKLN